MAYRRPSPDYGPMAGSGKQAHKVVMESVTQGKKMLHSEVSSRLAGWTSLELIRVAQLTFKTKPPAGYTFIPAGNPELTNALKEFARQANEKIFAVSVSHRIPKCKCSPLTRALFRQPNIMIPMTFPKKSIESAFTSPHLLLMKCVRITASYCHLQVH